MNTFKYMIEAKASLDPSSKDPKDPLVNIPGYGGMLLSQIKRSVVGKLEDMYKKAKRDNFNIADYAVVQQQGMLKEMIEAIQEAEALMSKPAWKRKITAAK